MTLFAHVWAGKLSSGQPSGLWGSFPPTIRMPACSDGDDAKNDAEDDANADDKGKDTDNDSHDNDSHENDRDELWTMTPT